MNPKGWLYAFVLSIASLVSACGASVSMRRLTDVELDADELQVADLGQTAFRRAARMDEASPVGEYAGYTGDDGNVSLVASPEPGCYVAVATTESPLATVDIGVYERDGEAVNANLQRNDLFRGASVAVKGFCLPNTTDVTVNVRTGSARMGFVVALYRVADADAIVSAVARLQEVERRGLAATLQEMIGAIDRNARPLNWEAPDFPRTMNEGQTVAIRLSAETPSGMCVAVVATGAGGDERDVDLFIHTGEPPVTRENLLAMDDRVSPHAAAAFSVPADPGTVRVAFTSYRGNGPVAFAAYSIAAAHCEQGRPPLPIPGEISARMQ